MKKRVVITGIGAITPVGNTVDEYWDSLKEGKHGFGPITQFDASAYKCKLVGEVKNFVAKDYIDPKSARRMARFTQFAVKATQEAMADSGLDMTKEDAYRVGTCIGSGVGSLQELENAYGTILTKGPLRVSPFVVPMMISNIAAGNVAIQFGLKGKSIDVVTACASGTNSIGEAFRTIQYGDADVMVAGDVRQQLHLSVYQHLIHLQHLHHQQIQTDVLFHLIRTEADSFSVRVQVLLFLRSLSTQRQEVQRSTQSFQVTDVQVMHTTSQHLRSQVRDQQLP